MGARSLVLVLMSVLHPGGVEVYRGKRCRCVHCQVPGSLGPVLSPMDSHWVIGMPSLGPGSSAEGGVEGLHEAFSAPWVCALNTKESPRGPAHFQAFCLSLIPHPGARTTVPDQQMQTASAVTVTSILLGGLGAPTEHPPLFLLLPSHCAHSWELGSVAPGSLLCPWGLVGF